MEERKKEWWRKVKREVVWLRKEQRPNRTTRRAAKAIARRKAKRVIPASPPVT